MNKALPLLPLLCSSLLIGCGQKQAEIVTHRASVARATDDKVVFTFANSYSWQIKESMLGPMTEYRVSSIGSQLIDENTYVCDFNVNADLFFIVDTNANWPIVATSLVVKVGEVTVPLKEEIPTSNKHYAYCLNEYRNADFTITVNFQLEDK